MHFKTDPWFGIKIQVAYIEQAVLLHWIVYEIKKSLLSDINILSSGESHMEAFPGLFSGFQTQINKHRVNT